MICLRVSPFCAFRRGLSSHAAMHHSPAGYGRARVITADHSVMPVDRLGKVGLPSATHAKIDLQPIIIRLSARKLRQEKFSFAYNEHSGKKKPWVCQFFYPYAHRIVRCGICSVGFGCICQAKAFAWHEKGTQRTDQPLRLDAHYFLSSRGES